MTVRRAIPVAVALAASAGIDLAVGIDPPGRYAAVGLVGAFAIVLVAKQVGRWLLRPEGSRAGDGPQVLDAVDGDLPGGRGA